MVGENLKKWVCKTAPKQGFGGYAIDYLSLNNGGYYANRKSCRTYKEYRWEVPIKMAYKSNHRYYSDFMSVLRRFKDVLSDKEFNELVSKFQFDKAYERHKYFEIVSEIIILDFVLRNYNQEKKFKYEPKYNGGYNPECSFINKSKTINIEVKCPNLEKRLNSEDKDKMKIFLQDRLPNFKEIENDAINKCNPQIEDRNNSGVEVRKRLDNALKSYLIHSQKKFPSSGDTYFNILAISLRTVGLMSIFWTQKVKLFYAALLANNSHWSGVM